MARSIEERVLGMSFENAKFEAGVAQTIASLGKLDAAIQKVGGIGAANGFANIEMAANKVTMEAPMSALDKLKAKLGFGPKETQGFSDVNTASSKVTMEAPMSALDKLKAKLGRTATEDAPKIKAIEDEGRKITLTSPLKAIGKVTTAVAGIGAGAVAGFKVIQTVADKFGFGGFTGVLKAVDKVQSRFSGISFYDTAAQIERASDKVTMSGLTKAIDTVKNQFSVLEGAAAVALGNIATQAINKGKNFASGFTIDPIKAGFEEFGTNMGSIQTILANTQDSGGNLKSVNAHLQELNHYSDQTIYNFSEMAKNIGTFTAAGVDLDKSTQSIKGIANLAALSGSNSQQASGAMYQLSQAISSGKVGLQDWNSVVNAGMGGAVFQKALMKTADNMGALEKGAVNIDKATGKATVNGQSFRESITAKPGEQSWLTSDVLVQTLQQFTGDMTKADLIAKGYTETQAKAILKQAETAKHAATEVKTLSGVFDVVKESVGSGWAATFQNIFGDFEQSKKLFTDMTSSITGFVGRHSDARNKVLADWKKMGGRDELLKGLKDIAQSLQGIMKLAGQAFHDIFPPTTGKTLLDLTKSFSHFASLVELWVKSNGPELKKTFAGVFAVIHIGWTIIKRVFGVFGDLFGMLAGSSGGILQTTASIGDFLVNLDKAISSGHALDAIFGGLTKILAAPVNLLKLIGGYIASLFGGADAPSAEALANSLETVKEKLGPLGDALGFVVDVFKKLGEAAVAVKDFLEPVFTSVVDAVSDIGQKIADAFASIDFDTVLLGLQTAMAGGIFLALRNAFTGGGGAGFLKTARQNIISTLDALNGSLTAIQNALKAATLLQIAIAIGVLAAGVLVLSKIDPKDLGKAMSAVAVGLGELVGAMRLLAGIGGVRTLPVVAGSMILLATALDILVVAVYAFSRLSWEELAKGLVGVGGALLAMMPGLNMLSGMSAKLLVAAPAMVAMAVAMGMLGVAMKIFGSMDLADIAKGLVAMFGAVDIMQMGLKAMGENIALAGPGMLALAAAMGILAVALGLFGSMSLVTVAKGVLSMTAALSVLAWAMTGFPPNLIFAAAGLVVLGIALTGIATAVGVMGSMGIGTLAKGLIGLGIALTELAVGMYLMIGTLPGAVALMAAAVALSILGPALFVMGSIPWGTFLKGLVMLGVSLTTIAIVGVVAAPALTLVGVALLALGIGIAAASTGIYILAKGLALLGSEGTKGVAVMVAAITAFVALIPKIVIDFVKGLVQIIEEVAKVAPRVAIALGVVIDSLLDTVIRATPKLATAIGFLIDGFLVIIVEKAPAIIKAGWGLLQHLLDGVNKNIDSVVRKASEILQKFLNRLTSEAPKIVKSGADTLVAFLNGIAQNLYRVMNHAAKVGLTFLAGIAQNAPKFVEAGALAIRRFLGAIADKLPGVIRSGANLIISFLDGISQQFKPIAAAATRTITRFLDAIGSRENTRKIVDHGIKAVIHFLQGIADGLRKDKNLEKVIQSAQDVGLALVEGIVKGLAGLPKALAGKLMGPLDDGVGFIKKKLKIFSPSRVFVDIGNNITEGLSIGLRPMSAVLDDGINRPMTEMLKQNKSVKEFGKFLGGDFAKAVSGGFEEEHSATEEKVLGGFESLTAQLKDQRQELRDTVKEDRAKLKELEDADKPDQWAIDKARDALEAHKALLAENKVATKQFMEGLSDEKAMLLMLATSYDGITDALEDAEKELKRVEDLRDDYINQYNTPPDFTTGFDKAMEELNDLELDWKERQEKRKQAEKEAEKRRKIDQVALYKKALEEQIVATAKYQETLAKLRKMGLDDETYSRLLKDGIKDQGFADQLLRGGESGLAKIKELNKKLLEESKSLSNEAVAELTKDLYEGGVAGAAGIVQGLKDKQAEIQGVMNNIAQGMVAAIKMQLGIRSPSRVMAELGRFTGKGLAQGLTSTSMEVASAAASVADDAASALTDSLSRISDAVTAEVDPDLTITPVLDLTQVQKDAKQLGDLTNVTPISAAASFGQAAAISDAVAATQAAREETGIAGVNVSLEQNNYSPEALSDVEIYRQTKNQLSQVKSALGKLAS